MLARIEEWKAFWDTECYMHNVFEEQLKHDTLMTEVVKKGAVTAECTTWNSVCL